MAYRTELKDIIYSAVQRMDLSMTIVDYTQSGTTHTVEVCDVKWLQNGHHLTIGGNDYTIVSVDDITNIVVLTGADPIATNSFNIYAPKYFFGTPIDTENQLKPKRLSSDKYPMIYFMLNYRERNLDGANEAIDRIASFRLFALSDSDFTKWSTDNIHDYAIKPMSRLMQSFMATLKSMVGSFFTEEFDWESIPAYKFGVFITNAGVKKGLFTNDLSGWEMGINDLQIRKGHTCNSCAPYNFPVGIDAMIIEDTFIIG